MITCPQCGCENPADATTCQQCQRSLRDPCSPQPSAGLEADMMNAPIRALKPRLPLTVVPSTPVGEVLQLMVAESIGCVTIVDGEELVGVFTEHDALHRLNVDVADYAQQPISAVMTPNPVTLEADDKIASALHKMYVGGHRHVPVLSDGKLIAIGSIRGILACLAKKIV